MHTDEQEIPTAEYLRDLAERLRHVPVMYGVDGYDVDRLGWIAADTTKPNEASANFGEFTVAVQGTFYSEEFEYSGTEQKRSDRGHKVYLTRAFALADAELAYARLTKHNPEKVVRLIDRPFIEIKRSKA
jgi:hypothetical protein